MGGPRRDDRLKDSDRSEKGNTGEGAVRGTPGPNDIHKIFGA